MRSVDAANESSKWSGVRKFTKKWNAVAALLTPASLQRDRVSDRRRSSPGRRCRAPSTYRVSVATGAAGGGVDAPGGIISNGALAWSNGGKPIETSNTNLAVSAALHPGTYYWQVVPVDAEGHAGTPSADLLVRVDLGRHDDADGDRHGARRRDLRPALPVGADSGRGELPDRDQHDLGLRDRLAGCSAANTTATSFAPTQTLPNNTYYWRVRGVDPQGQAGPWNNGPSFDKTYDQTVVPGPPNLHGLQLEAAAGRRRRRTSTSRSSRWDTVPGARMYEVQTCNCGGASTIYFTANTAWTPFADTGNSAVPAVLQRSRASNVRQDSPPLQTGDCCACRVRAFADNAIDGSADRRAISRPSNFTSAARSFTNPPTIDCTCRNSVVRRAAQPGADVMTPGPWADRRQEPAASAGSRRT